MSADLNFWKYEKETSLKDSEVYERLSSEEFVNGVAALPKADILEQIDSVLEDWDKLGKTNYEKDDEYIELYITDQLVRFDCSGVSGEHMNLLIDVMLSFGCPFYDSSIDVRFAE